MLIYDKNAHRSMRMAQKKAPLLVTFFAIGTVIHISAWIIFNLLKVPIDTTINITQERLINLLFDIINQVMHFSIPFTIIFGFLFYFVAIFTENEPRERFLARALRFLAFGGIDRALAFGAGYLVGYSVAATYVEAYAQPEFNGILFGLATFLMSFMAYLLSWRFGMNLAPKPILINK